MKSLQHIERSAFRRGEFVAYVHGAQRVRRCAGGWETYALASASGRFVPLSAPTLAAMDERIASLRGDSYQSSALA